MLDRDNIALTAVVELNRSARCSPARFDSANTHSLLDPNVRKVVSCVLTPTNCIDQLLRARMPSWLNQHHIATGKLDTSEMSRKILFGQFLIPVGLRFLLAMSIEKISLVQCYCFAVSKQ